MVTTDFPVLKNSRSHSYFLPLLLFGGSFAIYLLTLSPTINSFDSAELITGAYSLGIVHAPGYPLFLLNGFLFAHLPWGSPALNVNLLSALFTSFTIVTLYLIAYRLCADKWSSFLGTIIFAFSPLIWMHAVITEVYSLNGFLLSLIILLILRLRAHPENRRVWWLLLMTGLSLTHHPTAILLLPITGFIIWYHRRSLSISWRSIVVSILCIVTPLLLYLYLPLRFVKNPPLNYVADYFTVDLATFSGVWWMISGRMFAPEIFGVSLQHSLQSMLTLGYQLWTNMVGAGLLLAIAGLLHLLVSKKNLLALLFGGNAGIIFLFFALYNVIDNQQMIGAVQLLLTPLTAVGLARLKRDMIKMGNLTAPIIKFLGLMTAILVTFILLIANFPFANRHQDYTVYNRAVEVMDSFAENSIVVTQWTMATPLTYLQIVEGQRPDVLIIDRGLFVLGIRDTLARETNNPNYGQTAIAKLQEILATSLPERPVFLTEDDPTLQPFLCYEPEENNLYRVIGIKPDCEGQ
jgi:hypothetical protein